MGMMLERDAAPVDIADADVCSSSVVGRDSVSTQPSVPAARASKPRPRRCILYLVLRTIKGLFLIAEITAAALLLAYSGKLTVLPASPPAAHIRVANASVSTLPSFYCWLTPGRGICADASTASPAHMPAVTARHGATLLVTVASPAPTSCRATTTIPADDAAPVVALRATTVRANASPPSAAQYQVAVSLTPGNYLLTVTCTWTGRPTMRWLDGQGAATYSLALLVTP